MSKLPGRELAHALVAAWEEPGKGAGSCPERSTLRPLREASARPGGPDPAIRWAEAVPSNVAVWEFGATLARQKNCSL